MLEKSGFSRRYHGLNGRQAATVSQDAMGLQLPLWRVQWSIGSSTVTILLQTEQSQEGVEVLMRGMEAREIQPNDRTYW